MSHRAPEATPDAAQRDPLAASPGTVAIASVTIAWMVLVVVNPGPPFHLLEVLYLVLVPGLAITRAAGLRTSPGSVSLAVVLSVGLVGIAYGVLVVLGSASQLVLCAIVVAVTIGALAIDEHMTDARPGVSLEALARPDGDGASAHQSS